MRERLTIGEGWREVRRDELLRASDELMDPSFSSLGWRVEDEDAGRTPRFVRRRDRNSDVVWRRSDA